MDTHRPLVSSILYLEIQRSSAPTGNSHTAAKSYFGCSKDTQSKTSKHNAVPRGFESSAKNMDFSRFDERKSEEPDEYEDI